MTGLNNFDIIYYINLEHRVDRLNHINNELSKTNINKDKINRINAIYQTDKPVIGCTKSHCLALEAFIYSEKETCIIFEDDFEFCQDIDLINNLIDKVFDNCIKNTSILPKFDVLMLSSNTFNEIHIDNIDFVTKILDAQAASGYAISKQFAPILLENFKESILLMESVNYKVHEYCPDIYMKKLQPHNNWFCLNPKIGKQVESYSDIENKIVNYNC